MARPIERVLIVGGGVAAELAAALIGRAIPRVRVTLLAAGPPDPLLDRIAATWPSMRAVLDALGVDEAMLVARTGSGFRLGTSVEGWAEGKHGYLRASGEHGAPIGAAPFHQYWARAARDGAASAIDSFSAVAALARGNRFAPPEADRRAPLSRYDYGFQLTMPGFRGMLGARCRSLHVHTAAVGIGEIEPDGSGGIAAVRTMDGARHAADLFIDATGPAALLRQSLGGAFVDWGRQLRCDRILFAEAEPGRDPPPFDRAVALPHGWRLDARNPAGGVHALVYRAHGPGDAQARRMLAGITGVPVDPAPVPLRQGRRNEAWASNCVAIGGASVTIEPLAAAGLHLVTSAVERLIELWPDGEPDPHLIAEYNRRTAGEADRIRDLTLLHYLAADRTEPFWREAAAVEPSPSLAHALGQFRHRGRLPVHGQEGYDADQWLSVLLGQGVIPRSADPLADDLSPALAAERMAALAASIAAAAARAPTHAAALRALSPARA